jgi:hypothetical protein
MAVRASGGVSGGYQQDPQGRAGRSYVYNYTRPRETLFK